MTRCPKCLSNSIMGPTYQESQSQSVPECLIYRCKTCGYSETRPCFDYKEQSDG